MVMGQIRPPHPYSGFQNPGGIVGNPYPQLYQYGQQHAGYQGNIGYNEPQIKFQGDLGDDMQPPNTDDEDSSSSARSEEEDTVPNDDRAARQAQGRRNGEE